MGVALIVTGSLSGGTTDRLAPVSAHGMPTPGLPIVVDLDGTLVTTDTLLESLFMAVRRSPLNLLRWPAWLFRGRAHLKLAAAAHGPVSVERLPYHAPLIAWLRSERAKGRPIILATAADGSIARSVSAHLGLFDAVLASDGARNLKGARKLPAIVELIGPDFIYAGDSAADIEVWKAARGAVLVGVTSRVARTVRAMVPIEREFPANPIGLRTWLAALRVHQWIKNILLFVPVLTSFGFLDLRRMAITAGAFLSFSLAASATYMFNDLLDIDSDRAHPRKRRRPFASGRLPIGAGVAVAGSLLVFALAFAWVLAPAFFAVLVLYIVLTCSYSLAMKQYILLDVLVLAGLYTLRIIAGALVGGIAMTSWLLEFSFFLFLSLALIKRCSELMVIGDAGQHSARGRDYRTSDLAVLQAFGVGAGLSAIVVFWLFVSAPETRLRYATPEVLRLVAIGLTYWVGRLWIKTTRGEMHDDPIVFAVQDRGSRLILIALVLTTIFAYFVRLESLL